MAKILIHGHIPAAPSGLGRVTMNLVDLLYRASHDITVVGVGRIEGPPPAVPYTLYIAPDNTHYGQETLIQLMKMHRFDMVITIGDPWMSEMLVNCREIQQVIWLAYFTIDGHPMPREWKDWLAAVDVPLVCSRFAAEMVNPDPQFVNYVPFGVDRTVFRPTDKAAAKKAIGIENRFVVGCVARNQLRKNLPALFCAFRTFAKAHEDGDVGLYLHTKAFGEDCAWNIPDMIEDYDLRGKVWVSRNHAVDDRKLAQIYNAMDVFVLPTMGEGFGLPLLEAQACGVPAFATDCSAARELLAGGENAAIPSFASFYHARRVKQALIDAVKLYEKLESVYQLHLGTGMTHLQVEAHIFTEQFDQFFLNRELLKVVEENLAIVKSPYPHPRFHKI